LNGHIVGDQPLLDDLPDKIKIGLRSRRKSDLDFLEADLDQHVEHAPLARGIHRLDQRLIAIAKIDAAPLRRLIDHAAGPGSIGQRDRRERPILGGGVVQHR